MEAFKGCANESSMPLLLAVDQLSPKSDKRDFCQEPSQIDEFSQMLSSQDMKSIGKVPLDDDPEQSSVDVPSPEVSMDEESKGKQSIEDSRESDSDQEWEEDIICESLTKNEKLMLNALVKNVKSQILAEFQSKDPKRKAKAP